MIKEYRKISTIKAEQFNDTNDKDFFIDLLDEDDWNFL